MVDKWRITVQKLNTSDVWSKDFGYTDEFVMTSAYRPETAHVFAHRVGESVEVGLLNYYLGPDKQ